MLLAPCSFAAQREFSKVWKVEAGPAKKEPLAWFCGDTVTLDLISTQNGSPLNLTGAALVWELRGWADYTNLYAVSTGAVLNATNGQSRFVLSHEQTANLPETCIGFAKAVQANGTSVVLGWQTIKTEWADTTGEALVVTPIPTPYVSDAELAVVATAVENLDSKVSANQSALTNLQAEISGVDGRVANLESSSTVWSAAAAAVSGKSNAWNLAGTALQAESDPLWTAASGAVYQAIANAQPANYSTVSNLASNAVQPTDSDYTNALALAGSAVQAEVDPRWTAASGAVYQAIAAATPGGYAAVSNAAVTAYSWGDHRAAGYATTASLATVSNIAAANQLALTNLQAEISGVDGRVANLESSSTVWSAAAAAVSGKSNVWNLAGTALQAESDPLWTAASGAVYQAIANAQPANYSTVSNLAANAVQPTDSDYTNALALAGSAVQAEVDPLWTAASGAVYQAIAAAAPGGYAAVSNAAVTAYSWGDHRAAGYANASEVSAQVAGVSNIATAAKTAAAASEWYAPTAVVLRNIAAFDLNLGGLFVGRTFYDYGTADTLGNYYTTKNYVPAGSTVSFQYVVITSTNDLSVAIRFEMIGIFNPGSQYSRTSASAPTNGVLIATSTNGQWRAYAISNSIVLPTNCPFYNGIQLLRRGSAATTNQYIGCVTIKESP